MLLKRSRWYYGVPVIGILCLLYWLYHPDEATQIRISEAYGKLPLSFEVNQGQTDYQVKFLSRGNGYSFFLTANADLFAALRLGESGDPSHSKTQSNKEKASAGLRMRFIGANPTPEVDGIDQLPGKSNYFIGNSPANWRTDIANYARVRYRDLYPGIDMVYYGNQRQLEYDLIVHTGADPNRIRLQFQGTDKIRIDAQGDLILEVEGGELRKKKPFVYQETGDGKQIVSGHYVLKGEKEVGFQIGAYDTSRSLFIDPVLVYSTYLGGGGDDYGLGIATDSAGNFYITGETNSTNFPTKNPLQATCNCPPNGPDIFVAKLNAAGDALIYSTYIGGSGLERSGGIAVDFLKGNAYLTGFTNSTNFPTRLALQGDLRGRSDAFVTKLNPMGNEIMYSTYLGGSAAGSPTEGGEGIAIDSNGNAYIIGETDSKDFPTEKSVQPSFAGGTDVFITKLDSTGQKLIYSTYLGGSLVDLGFAIAVDSAGNAYVTGRTGSSDFLTRSPLQPASAGYFDVFVAKFNSEGGLLYSTYLGGSDYDQGNGIAADSEGNAYVTGFTSSTNFPTANPLQPAFGGIIDAFVTKLSPTGKLVYSTYLGGSERDYGRGIAVDGPGEAYVTGSTQSTNFPVKDPMQATRAGPGDIFVTKFNISGDLLLYSTYLGGTGAEEGESIVVDANHNAYVGGFTGSNTLSNFPLKNPLQPVYGGGFEAFIMKISDVEAGPDFTLTVSPPSQTIMAGASTSFTIDLLPSGGFAQPVSLSAALSPANSNVTTSFSSNTITPGSSSTLTVRTTANTQASTFKITITGGSGQIVRTKDVTLSVTAGNSGNFALTVNPATQTVTSGASAIFLVNIQALGNFTQPVSLSATIAPTSSGITMSLSPDTVIPGNNSTLTVNTATTTQPGNYTITIKGTSGSITNTVTAIIDIKGGPTFTITSLKPSQTVVGVVPKKIIIFGSNLPAGSTVFLDSTPVTPKTLTSTKAVIKALPAGLFQSDRLINVKLVDPNGFFSNTLTFTVGTGVPPSVTLSATPSSQSIRPGQSALFNVAINRQNFAANVSLSLSGVPAGATADFNPQTTAGNSSVLTISTVSTVTAGTFQLTLSGTATGLTIAPVTLTLTVQQIGSVRLSATPTQSTVTAGQNAVYTITIDRANFSGAVSLSVSGLPPGMVSSFNPASTSGNSSMLTITTAITTPIGTYSLNIEGTASGITVSPTSVALVVNAAAQPTVKFSITPGSQTVTAGQSADYTVALDRINFTGAVDLRAVVRATSVPTGMSARFSQDPVTGNSTVLTLSTTSATPAGTYTLFISGTASGATVEDSADFTLTVVSSQPVVSLSVNPGTQTILVGQSADYTVTLNRSNFSGPVTLNLFIRASASPPGLSARVSQNPVTESSIILTLSTTSATPRGKYTFFVRGGAAGATVTDSPDFALIVQ